MLLSAFDPVQGRTVILNAGDLFAEAIDVDLLVISAWDGFYQPQAGSMIATLQERCGLDVGSLPRQLDLTAAETIRAWITPNLEDLPEPPQWPGEPFIRFRRIAVVESPRLLPEGETERPVFQQLFRLLALLPLYGIEIQSVATPLLNTGRQQATPDQLYSSLIRAITTGFRHIPDMKRLVIFDHKLEEMETLHKVINSQLRRSSVQRRVLTLDEQKQLQLSQLSSELRAFQQATDDLEIKREIAGLLHELNGESVTIVTLGVSARRLVERLVQNKLHPPGSGLSLYQGINLLQGSVNAWTISCLHQVRVFGNWMAHADQGDGSDGLSPREVSHDDMVAMLMALLRILRDYPWPIGPGPNWVNRRGTRDQVRT